MSDPCVDLQHWAVQSARSVPLEIVEKGATDPILFDFNTPFALLGRSNRCHIPLQNANISFRHAYLQKFGGHVFCIDLGSRTGTNWDGERRRSGWLTVQQSPRIGPYQIRLARPATEPTETSDFPAKFNPLDAVNLCPSSLGTVSINFLNKSHRGQTWTINRMLTLVGSGPGCKLRLEDDQISQVHCGLLVTKEGLWVIDFLGRGGTLVDGSAVEFSRLETGQLLQIGRFNMQIRYEEEFRFPNDSGNMSESTELPTRETWQSESSLDMRDAFAAATQQTTKWATDQGEMSPEEFAEAILENKLLSREQIDGIVASDSAGAMTAAEFGATLLEQGLLTSWQIEQLIDRRGHLLLVSDRYRLLEQIGYGSMGTVYRAYDPLLDGDVALKFPRPRTLRKPRMMVRFRREAMIGEKLQHPNIVRTYGIDSSGNYFVMEYVAGRNLKRILADEGAQSPEFCVHVAMQIGEALQCAYRNAVVHRDVKPSNILISEDGTAKLFDLGLARVNGESDPESERGENQTAQSTRAGTHLGTTRYMSPEQATNSRLADARSDIYSLACTLYELLAGGPLFDSTDPTEVLMKHATEPVPPIPNLDPRLMEIVERGLAKKPEDRYQTPEDMACHLRHWREIHAQQHRTTELRVRRDADRATIARDLKKRIEVIKISQTQRKEILQAIDETLADRTTPSATPSGPASKD